MPTWLTTLLAAGRRHSASDDGMVQTIHDNAVTLGAACGTKESAPTFHADLTELAMSHGDLANLLRMALKAEAPNQTDYTWVRDVYDAYVVYEQTPKDDVSPSACYQRSYSILDGKVTFGDPVKVVAVTQYVPVDEAEREGLIERAFSAEQRDKLAKSGAAMDDGGFPIETVGDLRNAIKAYGRASSKAAAKAHIIKRAKALNATDELPEDWDGSTKKKSSESDRDELTGDLVPLVEKAVKQDGTIAIKVISAGQGSSGYYGADMLKRDGPKVFKAGLQMYADHPTISEESDRPERSIRDLVGTLSTDARWEENGAAGPGLYADAKVRSDVAPLIEELAPHIGVSIRALGKASAGEVDGKKVRMIDAIEHARSVDFVTVPGAGGRVLELIEAARQGMTPAVQPEPITTEVDVTPEELAEAQKQLEAQNRSALETAQTQLKEQGLALARMREREMLREASDLVAKTLAGIKLPDPTRERLVGQLAANPPVKDDALDRETLTTRVTEAAAAELAYLTELVGDNKVRGMGGEPPNVTEAPTLAESERRIAAALASL